MLLKELAWKKRSLLVDELSISNERRQKIIDFIRSKPAGKVLTYNDFMKLTNVENYGSIGSLITGMLKNDVIRRYGEQGGYTYAVVDDAHSVPLTIKKLGKKVAKNKAVKTPEVKRTQTYDIEILAKDFAWNNPENNNDLRAFVQWSKEAK